MAISDSQKVDLLFKKLAFGKTKTDELDKKSPSNEAIASPLLLRGDRVWKQSADIPSTPPSSDSAVVKLYNDALGNSVETAEDTTATDNRTWKTNLIDWISTEFGPQYIVKIFVDDPGSSTPETTGTRIFPDGSGNNDSFVFDYQAGVLHFPDANVPSAITGSKIPYVIGYRYIGELGVGSAAGEDANIANLTFSDTTIGVVNSDADIVLQPDGAGTVNIDTTTGLIVPVGNSSQRPTPAEDGTIRYNSETSKVEYFNGVTWLGVGENVANITSQEIVGDGSTTVFVLDREATSAGIIVSTNGVVQQPEVAYSVSGNSITFAEAPVDSDTVDIRFTAPIVSVTGISNSTGNNSITVDESGVANLTTSQSVHLPTYTVSEANALSNTADGQIIFVSNGDSGSPCVAVYSDNSWKTVSLGGNISSS